MISAVRASVLRAVVALAALAAAVLAAGCGLAERYPQDPERTLEQARGGVLRVGVADNPPWVRRLAAGDDGEPAGVEADLVRGFAASLGARVEWHWGGLERHLEALERFELDLVAGGLTAASPWAKRVGFTRAYYTERIEPGTPPGMERPDALAGHAVAVRPGTALTNRLAVSDAEALPAEDPWATGEMVAAPVWELEAHGYAPTGHLLHRTRHVLAGPPGENALLVALELHLQGREREIERRLREEVAP